MKYDLLILVLAILLPGCMSTTPKSFSTHIALPPGTAAQQAWDVTEWIAVLMMAAGVGIGVFDAMNGTGIKGPIALLVCGVCLLTLALTLSTYQKELTWIGAGVGVLAFGFACYEVWTNRQKIFANKL